MLLSENEIQEILAGLQKKLAEKQQTERAEQEKIMKAQGEKNKAQGEKFLAENRTKNGVKVLPSGLQYQVIKEGTGKSPKETDRVTVNYKGTLIDGTEFDSSYKRGKPATFPVNGVIRGWTEALQLMKEGSQWRLFISPELGYGASGTPGGPIGPNATLVFEVELLSVAK
jgi:FKBP-type peptidyl-prolyl cis-trans isomerase FklB